MTRKSQSVNLQALVRVAERLIIPSEVMIVEHLSTEADLSINRACLLYSYYFQVSEGIIEPLDKVQGDSVPLREKLTVLANYLTEATKSIWGGSNREQVSDKMKKMADRLSGGIELG